MVFAEALGLYFSVVSKHSYYITIVNVLKVDFSVSSSVEKVLNMFEEGI